MYKALKKFKAATDGFTIIEIKEGAQVSTGLFPDHIVAKLIDTGVLTKEELLDMQHMQPDNNNKKKVKNNGL